MHTKDECLHVLAVHCVGILIRAAVSELRFFMVTYDHAMDVKQVIEAIDHLINSKFVVGNLPTTFFVSSAEFLSGEQQQIFHVLYGCLAAVGVFGKIELGF